MKAGKRDKGERKEEGGRGREKRKEMRGNVGKKEKIMDRGRRSGRELWKKWKRGSIKVQTDEQYLLVHVGIKSASANVVNKWVWMGGGRRKKMGIRASAVLNNKAWGRRRIWPNYSRRGEERRTKWGEMANQVILKINKQNKTKGKTTTLVAAGICCNQHEFKLTTAGVLHDTTNFLSQLFNSRAVSETPETDVIVTEWASFQFNTAVMSKFSLV